MLSLNNNKQRKLNRNFTNKTSLRWKQKLYLR
nr:MAG TPA: hypothetical protein [Crassvirales sp.]